MFINTCQYQLPNKVYNPNTQDVSKSLKNYVSNLREIPSSLRPHSVASHPAGKDTQGIWRRIHLGENQK